MVLPVERWWRHAPPSTLSLDSRLIARPSRRDFGKSLGAWKPPKKLGFPLELPCDEAPASAQWHTGLGPPPWRHPTTVAV